MCDDSHPWVLKSYCGKIVIVTSNGKTERGQVIKQKRYMYVGK